MCWEDLENARAERAAREMAANEKGRGKRGRKRKVLAQEQEEATPRDAEAARRRQRTKCLRRAES
jgi:hypothetical protein